MGCFEKDLRIWMKKRYWGTRRCPEIAGGSLELKPWHGTAFEGASTHRDTQNGYDQDLGKHKFCTASLMHIDILIAATLLIETVGCWPMDTFGLAETRRDSGLCAVSSGLDGYLHVEWVCKWCEWVLTEGNRWNILGRAWSVGQ